MPEWWLIDCGNKVTLNDLSWAKEVGFDACVTYPDFRIPFDCKQVGLKWIPFWTDWYYPPLVDHLAFKNVDGARSNEVGGANPWPSFWAPLPDHLVKSSQDLVSMAGGHLDGVILSGSVGECHMPTQWDGHGEREPRRSQYWVFDDYALAVWPHREQPAGAPAQDQDYRTLSFIHEGMNKRMHELEFVFEGKVDEVWWNVFPFRDTYEAWALATGSTRWEPPHEKLFIPNTYTGPEQRIQTVESMNGRWQIVTGAEVLWQNWAQNLANIGPRINRLGMHMLAGSMQICQEENRAQAARILADLLPLKG